MAIKKTAVKKAATTKKVKTAAKKPVPKKVKAVKKPAPKKKKAKKGDVYECSVCGLAVSVKSACECDESCDLICCGSPMDAL